MKPEYEHINVPPPYHNKMHECSDMLISLANHIVPIIEEMDADLFELTDGKVLLSIEKINHKRKR
jgi:hypothetical protein|tara:strand:+ start:342 stop:536 length:195 start_codon:yes stop_codon:yes gene_type:complete